MTTPQFDIAVRSVVLKPVSSATGVRAEIVAGKGPKDTSTEIWLPAGVHQLVIDFDENRWFSIYDADTMHFGEWGPHKSRTVRVVLDKPKGLRVFTSTEDPSKPKLVGLTIFQLPAE